MVAEKTFKQFKGVMIDIPSLIGPDELAKKLGFKSAMSVYRRVSKGALPHYRIGRMIRFNLAEVLETFKVKTE